MIIEIDCNKIDTDKLKKGWLTREAATRLGVPFPFWNKKQVPILYDRALAFSAIQSSVHKAILANKVFFLQKDGETETAEDYLYLGGFIEVIPEPEVEIPETPTTESYISPFDGRVR